MTKLLLFTILGGLSLSTFDALASGGSDYDQSLRCAKILQFPQGAQRRAELEILPPALQSRPMTPALRHLVELTRSAESKQIRGETVSLVELEKLDPLKLGAPKVSHPERLLNLPGDLLNSEELRALQPNFQDLGFGDLPQQGLSIPVLKTHILTKIRVSPLTSLVAATEDGVPVRLENLGFSRRSQKLEDRASQYLVLAGIKVLSENRVLPEFLGITQLDSGEWMAVFPLPAGYESVEMSLLKKGLMIRAGVQRQTPEPFEREKKRIQPFEDLLSRLRSSQWPLQYQSLDLSALARSRPDLATSDLVNLLKISVWEPLAEDSGAPFLYPSILFDRHSSWLPSPFSNTMTALRNEKNPTPRIEVLAMSRDKTLSCKDSMVCLSLEAIDPVSRFGRITILRYAFFESLLNGQAKVHYLNQLLRTAPEEQRALLELIEFLAAPLKREYYLTFLSKYRAKKFRDAFQVIDGRGK